MSVSAVHFSPPLLHVAVPHLHGSAVAAAEPSIVEHVAVKHVFVFAVHFWFVWHSAVPQSHGYVADTAVPSTTEHTGAH